MGTVEGLECQARPPVLPGGQGQALKGLGRGAMGSELHFRMTNVKGARIKHSSGKREAYRELGVYHVGSGDSREVVMGR